jgi:hypothetical protein
MKSEKLLYMILKQERVHYAPTRIELCSDEWYSVIIGIGNDHTAQILIHDDDLKMLIKRNMENMKVYCVFSSYCCLGEWDLIRIFYLKEDAEVFVEDLKDQHDIKDLYDYKINEMVIE